jgi:hypothetical protein
MLNSQGVQEFEDYLDKIMGTLSLSMDEKNELREEWLQHLVDSKDHFMQKGLREQEAIEYAMKQFGGVDLIQSELKRSVVSLKNMHVLKELVIWAICLLAVSVGPGFFTGVSFQIYYITSSFFLLFCCYSIYHIMIKRGSHLIIPIVGLPIAYGVYASYYVSKVSWSVFLQNIFNFAWRNVVGGTGLFTLPSLHLLWVLMMAIIMFIHGSKLKKWHSILRGSFEYWFMIMIAMFIVTKDLLSFSSEMKVILLNVFLLYGLLQQLIVPIYIITSFNKLEHRLRRTIKNRV